MRGSHIMVTMLSLGAGLVLLFCSGTVDVDVDVRWDGDAARAGDGGPKADSTGPVEPLPAGRLYVVDADGRAVGALVARSHRLFDGNELFDAVTVYDPERELFFAIRMADAEVLRPAKVFFSGSNCSGTVAVRASCPDCRSGFDLGFAFAGQWYRIAGGVEREPFKYNSYVAEQPDSNCTGHGNSSTDVYPTQPLSLTDVPGPFTAPLRFVWGS